MSFDLLDGIERSLSPKKTVGIEEFAESSDFCGKILYPRQLVLLKLIFLEEMTGAEEDVLSEWIAGGRGGSEIVISPNIRERRDWLRENGYKHFREAALVGGRRSSKGFTTGMAMSKVLFDTVELGNPGQYYGIDQTKDIYFSCVAGSESQAKQFQYADFVSTIENCKALERNIIKSLETEIRIATEADFKEISAAKARGGKIQRDIARLRGQPLAANASTLRGSATMVITIDEMAHLLPGESKSSAEQIYSAAQPSLDQFGKDGMMFCNSSPFTKVGQFYVCYENSMIPFDPSKPVAVSAAMESDDFGAEATGVNGNPRNFVFQYPSWALFEGYRYYSSKHHKRERGKEFGEMVTVSPDWNPEEVDNDGRPSFTDGDKANILQARAAEAGNPETYKVERRGKFAEVSDSYLIPAMVDQMYQGIPDGMQTLPNGDYVKNYRPIFTNTGQHTTNLFRYKFHIDPSSTTAGFGFAIAHIEYLPDMVSGEETEHVVFDLVKRWDPKHFAGGVIRWKPILEEIMQYAIIFRPFEITMDQHQSAEPIQTLQDMLNKRGVQTRVYEVPTTNELNWKRWEVFKTALYQGLIHAPFDEEKNASPTGTGSFTSKDELKFLQCITTGGKFSRVEKQDIGPVRTKDMADAICVCVHALIGNLFVNSMRDRLAGNHAALGGQGGYAMGQGPKGSPMPSGMSGYYSSRDEKLMQSGMTRSALTRSALGHRRGGRRRAR